MLVINQTCEANHPGVGFTLSRHLARRDPTNVQSRSFSIALLLSSVFVMTGCVPGARDARYTTRAQEAAAGQVGQHGGEAAHKLRFLPLCNRFPSLSNLLIPTMCSTPLTTESVCL